MTRYFPSLEFYTCKIYVHISFLWIFSSQFRFKMDSIRMYCSFSSSVVILVFAVNVNFCIEDLEFRDTFFEQGRGAVYPPFTVLQFALGLAVPAQIPNRSVFTNFGTLNNVPLPSKITQLYTKRTKRMTRKFTHQNFYELLGKTLHDWSVTKQMTENMLQGDVGDCVLRSICQISALQSRPSQQQELLLEILQILFMPSKTKNLVADQSYIVAEQLGKQLAKEKRFHFCTSTYPSCSVPPLEMILHLPGL